MPYSADKMSRESTKPLSKCRHKLNTFYVYLKKIQTFLVSSTSYFMLYNNFLLDQSTHMHFPINLFLLSMYDKKKNLRNKDMHCFEIEMSNAERSFPVLT